MYATGKCAVRPRPIIGRGGAMWALAKRTEAFPILQQSLVQLRCSARRDRRDALFEYGRPEKLDAMAATKAGKDIEGRDAAARG